MHRTSRLIAPLLTVVLVLGLLATVAPMRLPAFAAAQAESPEGPTDVGSGVCRSCHAQPSAELERTGHGKMLSASGLPADMLGCEACHGPGSEHVGSTGKKPIGETLADAEAQRVEKICGKCHLGDSGTAGAPTINPKHWQHTRHAQGGVSCLSCHKIHGGVERSLKQAPSQLCLGCHAAVLNQDGQYTHRPVADGKCLLCHTPHGGKRRHNLVDTPSSACLTCHQAEKQSFVAAHSGYSVKTSDCSSCHDPHSFDHAGKLLGKFKHQPFAEGKCEVCHRRGAAGDPVQLVKPQGELCRTCHPAKEKASAEEAAGDVPKEHPPAAQGLCTTCHNPHAANYSTHLADRTDYLCFACHAKIESDTFSSYQHSPVATGNCLLCHQGHDATEKALLKQDGVALCNGCHGTQGRFSHPVGVWKGKLVRDPNTKQPMTCARCHAVHGSPLASLLSREEDALCRECHKR